MNLKKTDPEIYSLIEKENLRQQETINLIASENYASRPVLEATASALTNKYSEGYPLNFRHYFVFYEIHFSTRQAVSLNGAILE